MIIALMAGWVVAGLLLALLVGGAIRIAEARGAWRADPVLAPHDATEVATAA